MTKFIEESRLDEVYLSGMLRGHDFTKQQCVKDGIGIDEMTDDEKFERRKHYLGGSEIPDLFGEGFPKYNQSPAYCPINLYEKKKAQTREVISKDTQRMFDLGHFGESMVFEMLPEILPEGWSAVLDKDGYKDVEKDYIHADFDVILISPWGEKFLGEIKTCGSFMHPVSGVLGETNDDGTIGALSHNGYQWQVRYYMRELNVRAAIVFTLPRGSFKASDVKMTVIYRDFDLEDIMMNKVTTFWEYNIANDIKPEPITELFNSDEYFNYRINSLPDIGEDEDDDAIEVIDTELSSKIAEYCRLEDNLKSYKSEIERSKNEIILWIADYKLQNHSKIKCDGYTISRQIKMDSATFDKKLLKSKLTEIGRLDIYEECDIKAKPNEEGLKEIKFAKPKGRRRLD